MAETARQQPTFDAPLIQRPPVAPSQPAAAPPPSPASPPRQRVFVSDRPADGDAGRASPALARLAELVAHRGAETPFTLALVGGPGSGKSRALSQLAADAVALSRGADGKTSPYVPGLLTLWLDASDLGEDPRVAIAERLHAALSRAAPDIAAAAADEANHSAVDPHERLQSLNDSLGSSRLRLDAERRARDEAESRRARLTETILYESAGSRVDAYARANRASIESSLTGFGFTKGDPLATYKGLVHTLADAGGPAARMFASAKSLWAYRGQTKRLVWTVLFLVAAWGLGALARDQGWLGTLDAQGETVRSVTGTIRSHVSWFGIARQLCLLAALLCVLSCIWRAVRFSRPLLRGAALVDSDLAVRRGELDNLVAHHAQRVEALIGETDGLTRRAMDAEKRVGGARSVTPAYLTGDAASGADRSRRAYLAHVDDRISRDATAAGRIVVALDELDSLPPALALATLDRTAAALRTKNFGLVAAFDAERLVTALGPDARAALDRLVQIAFHVDAVGDGRWADVVAGLASPRAAAARAAPDAARSALDAPVDATEQQMLAALAPLAGPSPRGVKRFVNVYRLGRQDATDDLLAFAFALALAIGGTTAEKAAFDASLRDGGNALAREDVGRLKDTLDAINALSGRPITADEARRAKTLAARWTLEG